jgi:transcriptional regulator with XRE-family HTH domain
MSNRNPRGGSVTPPLVGIAHLRRALGYSLEDVCDGIHALGHRRPEPGTISGIELGHRRASDNLMAALLALYELDPDASLHVYPRPRLVPSPNRDVA